MRTKSLVAFGSWRCNCTQLAKKLEHIPDLCPLHNVGLLGARSWEQNPNKIPLGHEQARKAA